MALVKNIDFHIHGYDDFIERVLPELDVICNETLADPEGHFQIAIMEAVNNAAQYSLAGLAEAAVDIKMSIRDMDIKVSVSSETKEFDVKRFCDEIKALGKDKKWQRKTFGEFKGTRLSGRGIWLMLEACEYLYIDVKDKTVTMCVSYPLPKKLVTQNIGVLSERLFLSENGVIY